MSRILNAIIIAAMVLGCACGPDGNNINPDLCENVYCGANETCVDGTCKCNTGFYGKDCWLEPAKDCLASKVFKSTDADQLVVNKTGKLSIYNKYGWGVEKNSIADPARFCIAEVVYAGKKPPATSSDNGKLIESIPIVELMVWDGVNPVFENQVALLKQPRALYPDSRVTLMLFNPKTGALELMKNRKFSDKGTEADTPRPGIPIPYNHPPVIYVTITCNGSGECVFNFTGTNDQGSTTAHFLSFSVKKGDGTLLKLTLMSGETHKYSKTLAGGTYTMTATVTDPYGETDSKTLTFKVDRCKNVTCKVYQTCREIDGVCIGDDPCVPDPCNGHGTCGYDTAGKAVCTCTGNWDVSTNCADCTGNWDKTQNCTECEPGWDKTSNCTTCADGFAGTTCNSCDTAKGYVGTWPSCSLDPCFGVNCNGHGTCNSGVCICTTNTHWDPATNCADCTGNWDKTQNCTECEPGWDKTSNCTTCADGFTDTTCNACDTAKGYVGTWPSCVLDKCFGVTCTDDGDKCNGTEVCSQTTGTCISQNPITCTDDGQYCNGPETCEKATGLCKNPTPVTCNSPNGTCVELTDSCSCFGGWSGTGCTIPPPAPTINITPLPCASSPGWCSGGTYTVSFTYTGSVTSITGYCTVTGGATPGTISNITYSGGTGTFGYTTSPDGAAQQETLHLNITGPYGSDSDSETHWISN